MDTVFCTAFPSSPTPPATTPPTARLIPPVSGPNAAPIIEAAEEIPLSVFPATLSFDSPFVILLPLLVVSVSDSEELVVCEVERLFPSVSVKV